MYEMRAQRQSKTTKGKNTEKCQQIETLNLIVKPYSNVVLGYLSVKLSKKDIS